jgi:hypothetical protein
MVKCVKTRSGQIQMAKWVKGQSGNEAVQTLVTIMNDPAAAPSARTSAASAILDRGWGRPPAAVSEQESAGRSFIDLLEQAAALDRQADEENEEEESAYAC